MVKNLYLQTKTTFLSALVVKILLNIVSVAAILDSKMAAVENIYIFLNIRKTQTAREFILVARPRLAGSVSHLH